MKEDEMVLIEYTGRTEDGVFDTTREEDADLDETQETVQFDPIPVLVGRGYVIPGLDEEIQKMDVGDSKEISVPSEKAYGDRSSDKIETYPEREFKKQNVSVSPGEEVMIGNRRGRVLSAGSGRVRIDFNHPLSGKTLDYDFEIFEKVEDEEEIARYIYEYRIGADEELKFEDGKVLIQSTHSHGDHKHELPEDLKETVEEEIETATDLEVEFV